MNSRIFINGDKMNSIFKTFIVFTLILCAVSCKMGITYSTLYPLKKGMSEWEARSTLDNTSKHIYSFELKEIENKKVVVDVYKLMIGDYQSIYFIAYVDEKLIYWRFPHEFAKHKDILINDIGRFAYERYLKAEK
jgi:hypothetical protein